MYRNFFILAMMAVTTIAFLGCMTPANYKRVSTKKIDTYYSVSPKIPFVEIRLITTSFREYGLITGSGSDEMMIKMLKDKAAGMNADAIMNINKIHNQLEVES